MTKPLTPNQRAARRAAARAARMQRLKDQGWTLHAIGRRFGGISRQRVKAILSRVRDAG